MIYEAYFSLMTNLSFLTTHGAPRSIMLTSSRPKEGKSNSSLCLATVLAATGKSVILVDADIRNPSLNRYFSIPNDAGLSHYLSGDDNLDDMISELPSSDFWSSPTEKFRQKRPSPPAAIAWRILTKQ